MGHNKSEYAHHKLQACRITFCTDKPNNKSLFYKPLYKALFQHLKNKIEIITPGMIVINLANDYVKRYECKYRTQCGAIKKTEIELDCYLCPMFNVGFTVHQ